MRLAERYSAAGLAGAEPGAEPGLGAGAWMKTEAVLSLRLGL